ncbi:MAG: hypothetical protein Q4G03_09225 [Planctomycetia bacterium]|nr:hypothetical protein [Planctomycetia bacterium]
MTASNKNDRALVYYQLLFGLLPEDEAEQVRQLLANDATEARLYEDVRVELESLQLVTRLDSEESIDVVPVEKNVAVEQTYAAGSTFAYDAAVDSFDKAPFVEPRVLESEETVPTQPESTVSSKKSRQRRDKKQKKNKRENAPAYVLPQNERQGTALERAKGLFSNRYFIVRSIIVGALNVERRVARMTIFQRFIATLFLFVALALLGFWTQEQRLKHFFREDFYVQTAIPQTLVRGLRQSICVSTTGLNGNPKKTPASFYFTDVKTNEFLLAHTESGNVGGTIKYDLHNTADFPDAVRLSVLLGANEKETFSASLNVVDYSQYQSFGTVQRLLTSLYHGADAARMPLLPEVVDILSRHEVSVEDNAQGESENENAAVCEHAELTLFPETGRFVANYPNQIAVYASDEQRRPFQGRFALCEGEEQILVFETDAHGYASFEFTFQERALYTLSFARDVERETVDNNAAETLAHVEDSATIVDDVQAQDAGEDSAQLGQNNTDSVVHFTDYNEPYYHFSLDATHARGVIFEPCTENQGLYCAVCQRVLDANDPIELRLDAKSRVALLLVVEKNGVIVTNSLLSANAKKHTFVDLPSNVHGLMRVLVYQCERNALRKVAETTIFRRVNSQRAPELTAQLLDSDTEEGAVSLKVQATLPPEEQKRLRGLNGDQLPLNLEVYAAPSLRDAVLALDVDEALESLEQQPVQAVVATTTFPDVQNRPLLFDNVREMRQNTVVKLQEFRERETQSSLMLIRIGLSGFIVLATASVFFMIINALNPIRGGVVLCCAVVLTFFFYTEQKSLDSSFELSKEIEYSVDENAEASSIPSSNSPMYCETWSYRADPNKKDVNGLIPLGNFHKAPLGESLIPLEMNQDSTSDDSVLLVKLHDDNFRKWTLAPLNVSKSQEEVDD